MPLTDSSCRNAHCAEGKTRERFADAGGLYLEVAPSGSRRWFWKYRFEGKEKRLALGAYPEVPLTQARRGRDAARDKLREGIDPVQAKKDAVLARRVDLGNSFESVARSWHEHWSADKSSRHADYVIRRLRADVFPTLGAKPAADITAPQLLAMAKRIEARGAVDIAKRSLQTCGQILRFAVAHGILERNPAADVKPSDALKPRKRGHYARLEAKELPALLRHIEAYQGNPYTRTALKLMALTFLRTTELIELRWDEVDLEAAQIRIPAERMKLPTPHLVPLATQAVDALRCLQEFREPKGFLFPNERDHERPMSSGAILMALRRMGYANRMTGHGFRGIASTILHEHDFEHAHIELQLAHMERDEVSAAYNFATYLKQRRKMMQWWADHLDELRKGAKVVPIRAA
jgi:integrase